MITLTGTSPVDNLVSPANTLPGAPAKSISSFADQLATAIEQFLGSSKTESQIEIDLGAAPSQDSGARQFTISVNTPATPAAQAAATPAAPATPATQAASTAPLLTPDGYPQALLFYGALGTDTVAAPPATLAPPKPTSTDAYWAQQPAAVQKLRTMDNFDARTAEAQKLLQQGYTIDYPIMVERWSPLATMQARQAFGYTWVPSFMQPGIQEMPGLSYPGLTPYDPSHPPAKSILVSTDFALGTQDDPTITPDDGAQGTKVSAT